MRQHSPSRTKGEPHPDEEPLVGRNSDTLRAPSCERVAASTNNIGGGISEAAVPHLDIS